MIIFFQASPMDIKKLDEMFQIIADNMKMTSGTEAELVIKNPDESCLFVKELRK